MNELREVLQPFDGWVAATALILLLIILCGMVEAWVRGAQRREAERIIGNRDRSRRKVNGRGR